MAHTVAGIKRRNRIEQKRTTELKAAELLAKHNKKKEKKQHSKRKTYKDILARINEAFIATNRYIRPVQNWISGTYNEEKQIVDFIRWAYCRYQVPLFMFKLFLPRSGLRIAGQELMIQHNKKLFFSWFLTIAQGGSFYKETKGFFTKKEAFFFLHAPNEQGIIENIWWARCKAAGMSNRLTTAIIRRYSNFAVLSDDFWQETIRFFVQFEDQIDNHALYDVIDYLVNAKARNAAFSLKGRTFNSLIKASNDWHKEQHLKKFGDLNLELKVCSVPDWSWHDKKEDVEWRVKQLLTSKELYREGKVMRHCVAGYATRCRDGHSYIFSITKHDFINIPENIGTVELDHNLKMVQARGKFNASLEGKAAAVLEKWKNKHNIKSSSSWWW